MPDKEPVSLALLAKDCVNPPDELGLGLADCEGLAEGDKEELGEGDSVHLAVAHAEEDGESLEEARVEALPAGLSE